LTGSTSNVEGCTACAVGSYSTGGAVTSCTASECPLGQYASIVGAVNSTDGCIDCGVGTYSTGAASTTCAAMACSPGQ